MKVISSFLLFLLSMFLLNNVNAQNTLADRFGEEAIASIQGTEKLAILEFQNENGYAVQDLSGLKDISEQPDALEVAVIIEGAEPLNENSFGEGFEMFAYDFPVSSATHSYYRIGNTGKLLTIYSLNTVKKKFAGHNEPTE